MQSPRRPLGGDGAGGDGPLVWVTRAEPGAARTAARLRDLGFTPLIAPLIATGDLPGPPPDLSGVAALAFTSARGVDAFAARASPPLLPVFAVGDATAEAARAAGFSDVRSAAGAGRDLLALILRDMPPEAEVLHLGAREPAFDLVGVLRAAGRQARSTALYDTVAVESLPDAVTVPIERNELAAILIHSPAAARALAGGLRAAPAPATSLALIALSSECAAPLADLPFLVPHVAAAPDESSLLAALLGAGLDRR